MRRPVRVKLRLRARIEMKSREGKRRGLGDLMMSDEM